MFEILLLTITPLIIGFVGERYKDTSTINYALFLVGVILAVKIASFVVDGGTFIPDSTESMIWLSLLAICCLIFDVQKRLRHKKSGSIV